MHSRLSGWLVSPHRLTRSMLSMRAVAAVSCRKQLSRLALEKLPRDSCAKAPCRSRELARGRDGGNIWSRESHFRVGRGARKQPSSYLPGSGCVRALNHGRRHFPLRTAHKMHAGRWQRACYNPSFCRESRHAQVTIPVFCSALSPRPGFCASAADAASLGCQVMAVARHVVRPGTRRPGAR